MADDRVAVGEAHDDDAAGARRVAVDRVASRSGSTWPSARDEQQLLVLVGDLLDGRDDRRSCVPSREMSRTPWPPRCLRPELGQRRRACRSRSRSGRGGPRPGWTTLMRHDRSSPLRASRMPMTPAASRPIGRTSSSAKRASMPCAVAMMTSSSPDETSTQASSSSSAMVIARMPGRADALELLERRLLDDALAGRQDEVADPASKSGSVIVASGNSPDSTWTPGRLMIGMPLAWRLASGIGVDLGAENTRPRLVKNSAQSWVFATSRCSTASSSRVTWPMIALAAAVLAAVGGDRLALDVAAAG